MRGESHHILLVEDDLNDVLLVQRAFRKGGVPATIAPVTDGESAVAYLSGEGKYSLRENFPLPHLVLLDLKLPRKSGLEVLTWIRQTAEWKRLPVAVLTSSRHQKDITLAYEIGANSYLVKPAGFDGLLEMIDLVNRYWFGMNQHPSWSEF